jgi:hypothetical protein
MGSTYMPVIFRFDTAGVIILCSVVIQMQTYNNS